MREVGPYKQSVALEESMDELGRLEFEVSANESDKGLGLETGGADGLERFKMLGNLGAPLLDADLFWVLLGPRQPTKDGNVSIEEDAGAKSFE